mgnify:CR=1 FL=1
MKERDCFEIGEYINGRRKRHATGIGCREDAEAQLAEFIVKRQRPDKADHEITLGELFAYYMREHVPTLASPATAIKCFERLLPFWGEYKLTDVRKSASLEYLAYRKNEFIKWQKSGAYETRRELSNETVRRELEQLQAAIRYAHKDNLISMYPSVWKPKKSPAKNRWLRSKEAAKLLGEARKMPSASEYLPLFILLALYTGARSEAVLTLKWSQIDFASEVIDFRVSQRSSNKGRAVVPIPRRLLRELTTAYSNRLSQVYVLQRDCANDEPIKSVKNSFGTACQRAGLEDVTPHTLRHTAASWLVQKGVPIYEVARYLGHSSVAMVEKTYGHMAPEHLKRAKESWG